MGILCLTVQSTGAVADTSHNISLHHGSFVRGARPFPGTTLTALKEHYIRCKGGKPEHRRCSSSYLILSEETC